MKKSRKNRRARVIPATYTPAEPLIAAFNQAESYFAQHDYITAKSLLIQIIQQDNNFLAAHRQLGICEFRTGATDDAIKHLAKYLDHEPDDLIARATLAQAYSALGELTRARQQLKLTLKSDANADLYFLAAEVEEKLGEFSRAEKFYQRGLLLDPERMGAKLALASVLRVIGNYPEAFSLLSEILAREPDNALALTNLAVIHHTVGAYERAVELFDQALGIEPHADIFYNQGLSYQQLRKTAESIACFESALTLSPSHSDAKLQLAESWANLGDFKRARALFEELLIASPNFYRAAYLLTQITPYENAEHPDKQRLLTLNKQATEKEDIALVNFGLAKIYDDLAEYNKAFEHVEYANKLRFKFLKNEADRYIGALSETPQIATPAMQIPPEDDSLPTPIFIVGMPRSGTTLLEKLICSNAQITSCGEVDFFGPAIFRRRHKLGEFAEAEADSPLTADDLSTLKAGYLNRIGVDPDSCRFFVDKTPDNFKFFPLLQGLFPRARFIHCRRQPMDTLISIYFQLFEGLPYSYDLNAISKCHAECERLIRDLKAASNGEWFTQDYENLVTQPDVAVAAILKFLGVETDAPPYQTPPASASITTMSRWQARQSIYHSSIDRWKNYAKYLAQFDTRLEGQENDTKPA